MLFLNLQGRLEESQRLLVFQKSETQRLKDSAEVERGRSRELERQLEQCRQNLEDHRRQLEWQQSRAGPGGGASSSSSRRLADSDFRDRLRKKDHEIAEQLDKIEVCTCMYQCTCMYVQVQYMYMYMFQQACNNSKETAYVSTMSQCTVHLKRT